MSEKKIKLTEGQIKDIIDLTVRKILSENSEEEWGNVFTKDGRNDLKNFGKSFAAGAKAGAAAMRGNYQANQDKSSLYGSNANLDAEARLRDINNACRELRKQYVDLLAKRKELEVYCQNKGLVNIKNAPFKGTSYSPKPTTTPNPSRFKTKINYTPQNGNIGDLTSQGVAK